MKEKRIFVSHYNKDNDRVKTLLRKLSERPYFKFKSSTIDEKKVVKSTNEKIIRKKLGNKIKFADTFIVAIGRETHKREWVNWEIEEAVRSEKNIVGVYLHGERDSIIPEGVEVFGNALVGWNNIDKIVEAIRGEKHWNPTRGSKIAMKDVRAKC
jgi:hypothetical protein